mmetsp:Transcript_6912/g.19481  ORF Transcript_6912/g.19481 Transcript_6912/m.19481 type:complete len:82 (-) Transcript_6912:984-1229(-)
MLLFHATPQLGVIWPGLVQQDTFFGVGLSRTAVGTYLALWIIIYGQVQSWSPQLILSPLKQVFLHPPAAAPACQQRGNLAR